MLAALVRGDQVEWPFTGAAAERQFLDAARGTASSRSSPGSIVVLDP